MVKHTSDLVLEVIADDPDPARLESDLNTAVALAQDKALLGGRSGVLVTRHSYTRFTVAVSGEVPFGITQERQDWHPES